MEGEKFNVESGSSETCDEVPGEVERSGWCRDRARGFCKHTLVLALEFGARKRRSFDVGRNGGFTFTEQQGIEYAHREKWTKRISLFAATEYEESSSPVAEHLP